jgi:hypothetical protein
VVDLPIHCKKSNLLQRNSTITAIEFNNHPTVCVPELFCSGGDWRRIAVFGGFWRFLTVFLTLRNSTCLCGIDLQCGGSGRSQVIDSS